MSGHSKWNTIKRKKGAADAARGKLFGRLIRQIEIAAREGGSDIDANFTLADAVQRAKDNSVPKDTIERALKRGAGELEGNDYQEIQYEGYAPGGVAVLVDCLSDNRNRTAADVRSAFTKAGGSLSDPGAVAYLFNRKGQVIVEGAAEDDVMMAGMEAGLEDVEAADDQVIAWCEATDVRQLRKALEESGLTIKDAATTMVPSMQVPVTEASDAKQVLRLLELLDDLDDVQEVHANFDMSDELMESAAE